MKKSNISFLIDMFSKLSTAIFLFSSIYIYIFSGLERIMSVTYIWGVLAQAFLLTVAYIPFRTEKEMSKRRLLISNICYFIFADLVVLGFGLLFKWFTLDHPITIIAMELTFVVVFIVVYLVMYLTAKSTVSKMNEQLKKLKQN